MKAWYPRNPLADCKNAGGWLTYLSTQLCDFADMSETTSDNFRFRDHGDWPAAAVCLVFLAILPAAIIGVWIQPRETIPLIAALFVTLLFAISAPFLLKTIATGHSRDLIVNPILGEITVVKKRLLKKTEERFAIKSVRQLVLEISNDEGYWYTAYLDLKDKSRIGFAQGGNEAKVRAEVARMCDALKKIGPPVVERSI